MYEAKIVLDSVGPNGARLTTFEFQYPRFIHAELMTHRIFSRNSASSRAIPTQKLMERVQQDPVLPVWWGANERGMQATGELHEVDKHDARVAWLSGRDAALEVAERLHGIGLHKQIANRVIEPWMFITVLVTATEFSNYFALRRDKAAQPEFRHVAEKSWAAYDSSNPIRLKSGEWHTPLVTGFDGAELRVQGMTDEDLCKISVGRCAAISYLNHEGRADARADIGRAEKLGGNGHMSPYEHVAQALTQEEWELYGIELMTEWISRRVPPGNFWGWKQFRKTLANEHDFSLITKEALP